MLLKEIIPKLTDVNTELAPEDRGDIAELLIENFGSYEKLSSEQLTQYSDFVTVYGTEESGFRIFNGPVNERAGEFSYPIYRKVLRKC